MRVYLLAVEGVHDIAFVQRILEVFEFVQKRLFGEIPKNLSGLVPRDFPSNNEKDLTKRVDVPHFHVKNDHWIVVVGAGGDSGIVDVLSRGLWKLSDAKTSPASVGLILDADDSEPNEQLQKRSTEWTKKAVDNESLASYSFPSSLGISSTGQCPFGVFVMPDNVSKGSLENILLAQAKKEYPVLHGKADAFIQDIKVTADAIPADSELTRDGRHEGKAILHAMTSVLKPGKTLQASISKRTHRWVPAQPDLFPAHFQPLVSFLKQLLEI